MMRLVMESAGLTFWPSFSLAIFLASSLVMVAWLYRPGSRAFYRNLSAIALDDKQPQTGRED